MESVFERKRRKSMCISNSNQNQIRLNFLSFGPLTDVAQTCLRQCESVENRRARNLFFDLIWSEVFNV